MRLIETGGGGLYWLVERSSESGSWSPIDQEQMRACSRAAHASYMAEINAIRSYRPREMLGNIWAALLIEHARKIQELLARSGVPIEDLRIVEVSVTRRVV